MTVKELIDELSKFDPNLVVYTVDPGNYFVVDKVGIEFNPYFKSDNPDGSFLVISGG